MERLPQRHGMPTKDVASKVIRFSWIEGLDMTRRGYGPEVVAKAREIGSATEAILVSNFKSGFDRLDAVRAKYGNEPWFKYVRGNVTFFMLELPEAEVRERGPKILPDVSPHYDPMPVLRSLNTPQLWIL